MRINYLALLLGVLTTVLFSSCGIINSSFMLKTPKDYNYSKIDSSDFSEYKIAANDQISFQLFANDAFKLIDMSAGGVGAGMQGQGSVSVYGVELNGEVKLPVIGKVKLEGLTVRQAEQKLEQLFSTYYNKPFIIIKVLNKRVFMFPGAAASARVITLSNENTSLVEAIALAGGIATTGKAYRIKLIRGDLKNPKVFLIDLSSLEGAKQGNMLVQANDIIYVDQVTNYAQGVLGQISPYIGLLSSVIVLSTLIFTIRNNAR
jgi:polysaccharide export outer membrane protein